MNIPENIKNEYNNLVNEINSLYTKMNNIYDTVSNIKRYQKMFVEKEKELDENLNGKYLEYINIDQYGEHSFKKRKVADGKWEQYRDALFE